MEKDLSVYELLKSVSRTTLNSEGVNYIRSCVMSKESFWRYIYQKAELEGVSGLLYSHLANLKLLNFTPDRFQEKITKKYKLILRKNMDNLLCLINLEKKLSENNVQVIVLQGFSLLHYYRDPGLRPMSDIDILVKPRHKQTILGFLKSDGFYSPFPGNPDLVIKKDIIVDIHTHPLNIDRIKARRYIFPEEISGLWQRALPVNKSQSLFVMDIYDSFLCLSAHALKHCYGRLIWLCDLNEQLNVLLQNKNGWNSLIMRAESCGQKRILLYTLMILELTHNIKIPSRVKKRLNFQRMNIIENRIIKLISKGIALKTAFIILSLFNIKGSLNKILYIKESVFPRKKIMARMAHVRPVKLKIKDYYKRMQYVQRTAGKDLVKLLFGE